MRTTAIWIGIIAATSVLGGCASSGTTTDVAAEHESTITHPELRDQLKDLFRRDQKARHAMLDAMRKAKSATNDQTRSDEVTTLAHRAQAIDAESSAFLSSMIDSHGWPTFDMVGEDGAHAAWLLAQHADAQPALQKQVLALMEPLVEAKQADAGDFAYLMDRVLVAEEKAQVYGTQFGADSNGIQRPYPIANAEEVDLRRARVGIEPMSMYVRSLEEVTGAQVSAEPMTQY